MHRVLLPQDISGLLPPDGSVVVDLGGLSMGTTWSVRLAAPQRAQRAENAHWQSGIQRELDAVVAEMSHWEADSNLARFNQAQPGSWQTLPSAFFKVLAYAIGVARDSGGAYDPAAGAVVNLWGFGPVRRYDQTGFCRPSADAIEPALAQGGWQRIELDAADRRARQPGGALLDLSGVAKGYAVDGIARYLHAQGIGHYLINVGGELRGAGMKPDGQPWWVALENPTDTEEASASASASAGRGTIGQTLLALHGLAVATSGDYRRYFREGSTHYSHTIDPRTGWPIRNGIASVTVVHQECMAADAWSTALTVLGVEEGLRLAEKHALAARFLVRGERGIAEHMSSCFHSMLQ